MFDEVQGVLHAMWPVDTDALLAVHAKFRRLPADQLAHLAPARVAILGGYTTKFVTPLVQLFLARAGILAEMWEGDYGLAEQVSHDPAQLAAFKPDVVFLCVGTEHLDLTAGSGDAARWKEIWRRLHEATGCDVIQNTFEPPGPRLYGSFDLRDPQSPASRVRDVNAAMLSAAPPYVHFNDVEARAAQYGRAQWRDQTLYDMTKLPCAFDALPAYARSVSAVIAALRGRSKKCLVVDLDNTLWGGVLGDDGIANVRVGAEDGESEAFARFQRYLKALRQRGVLLAISSKNDESLVRQCFAERRDMPLGWSDFAATAINWEPKDQNLMQLASKLSLGLDAFVFVDDNPAEREIVRQLPLVEVVELPEDPAGFADAVAEGLWFEAVSLTGEDRDRTAQYQANALRDAEWQSAGDYNAFLKSLAMTANVQPVTDANVVRVTQLINKTNQFNLTTRRYQQSQVERMAADPNWITLTATLADRFGDNGLISIVLAETIENGSVLNIDTWLMSCRVLKRGVESLLWHELLRVARSRGVSAITATHIPTDRNAMVARLFEELGAVEVKNEAGTTFWRAPVTDDSIAAAAERLAPIAIVSGTNQAGSTH